MANHMNRYFMRNATCLLGVVLLTVALDAALAAESPSGAVISAGQQFVDLLAKGDFAAAVGRFDSKMKAALPEPELRKTWQTVQAQAGPFQKQLRARVETLGGFEVVIVTCQFERATLDVKVVLDARRQLSGLWFAPTQAATSSPGPPPYAKDGAYREMDFPVGTGEWRLPGTLTLPVGVTGPLPALVLVHGSGPNDRDETILANKPFRDLAWGLASKGIVVLRYEKRTKQYAAKLAAAGIRDFTVKEETIDDALAAAAQLRTAENVDPKRVFVLGHSLGGLVAPESVRVTRNWLGSSFWQVPPGLWKTSWWNRRATCSRCKGSRRTRDKRSSMNWSWPQRK